jgi:hypothetical protein
MSKTPITWLELINQKLSALKKAGKSASIREVAPEAKAEWTKIKAGTHPDFIQGKAKTHARKHKKDKTQKVSSSKNNNNADAEVKKILATLKLCRKCSKQVNKLTKDQKGGACTSFADTGPQPQPNTTQQLAIVEKDVQPIEATSSLANVAEAVTQKGGNCGACSFAGGKKSKKNKSKKNKSRHTKKK